jgi:ferredoxin
MIPMSYEIIKITCIKHNGDILKVIECRAGSNIWVQLRKNQVPIGASCSGVGVCKACLIEILEGEVSPASELEVSKLGSSLLKNQRLSCLARAYQDIQIKTDYW